MKPRAIKPRKLGHLVLAVRDIHKSVAFYTEVLGLTVSDWISDQMCFLRAGSDHHDLALAQIPKDSPDIDDLPRYSRPGMEHFSYLVDSVDDMEEAVEVLRARGVEIVRGIGKHGPGENCFLVFKDPDGNNVEIYCDMQQIAPGEPHQSRVWERNIESFDQWRFARFVVPPPSAVVKEKSGRKD
ncbi:MAG: VOC family protein [Burkholderiales bacterium]|nr:VOC family protein [Burkholderiales bacterium]